MTTADRWTQTVRKQLGLGRLLPLGGPRDGAWIAERAAREVLLGAAREVAGVSMGGLRIGHADPEDVREPAVPPPPSALPPGPLRVTADFAATVSEPLPATAARLRAALAAAATQGLGLTVTDVDLRVTALLEAAPGPAPGQNPERGRAVAPEGAEEARAADAALAVPGVAWLTDTLGRPVHITERPREAALPQTHVLLELAVSADHQAAAVARQVRAAVSDALPDHPSVAVLVTAVG
ncbi:nucleopolyhedrovirus P10 family protein [Streptomyces viridiviolaceus]